MYQYTPFDREFIRDRALQFRDQLTRNLNGKLSDDEFKPLRLQNGWYVQRYAPMLRVAVPYGELSSTQLRTLAVIARDFDKPTPQLLEHAQSKQDLIGTSPAPKLTPKATITLKSQTIMTRLLRALKGPLIQSNG